MGRMSDGKEADLFFEEISRAFFQASRNVLFIRDILKILTKKLPIVGRGLAVALCEISSSPLAYVTKCETDKTTSLNDTGLNVKPPLHKESNNCSTSFLLLEWEHDTCIK